MKYLICGNYGVGNIGDECIALGIKKLLSEKDQATEFEIMGKGMLLPIGLRSGIKSLFNWRLWKYPLGSIRRTQVFVLDGGGLFTDEERPGTGFFWALHGLVAHWIGKPVIVLGVSMGKMGVLSRFFTRLLFRRAKKVYCRDEKSVKTAKELSAREAIFCPDMSAMLSWSSVARQSSPFSEKYVVFVLRAYKNITEKTITNFIQMVEYIHAKYGFKSILISFDNRSNNSDNLLYKKLIQKVKSNKISIHKLENNLNDIARLLQNAELVISMRYHGALLALLNKTPFISINYMEKSSNFWKSIPGIKTIELSDLNSDAYPPTFLDSVLDTSYSQLVLTELDKYCAKADIFRLGFTV